jgi:hypothetical protein
MTTRKTNGNGGQVGLTLRELVIEVRGDVKTLQATVTSKADKADLEAVKANTAVVAQQAAHQAIESWQEQQEKNRSDDRKWKWPLIGTLSLTLILGLLNLAGRILHWGS